MEWEVLHEKVDEKPWVTIPLKEYGDDMSLTGEDLTRQLAIDVPRMRVFLMEEGSKRVLRIKSGEVFELLVRRMCLARWHDAILALATQTVMARPLRCLTKALPEGFVACESGNHLSVKITFLPGGHCHAAIEKVLLLRDVETMNCIRSLHFTIEANTRKEEARILLEIE